MKLFMSSSLSLLLALQPALAFAGAPKNVGSQAEIREFIKKNNLSSKSLSFADFYSANKDLFDSTERGGIEKLISENPQAVIPKFDVTMIKDGNGHEIYQLQSVADGQSVSLTIYGQENEFVKISGVGISVDEGRFVKKTLAKIGVPGEILQYYFGVNKAHNFSPKNKAQLFGQMLFGSNSIADGKEGDPQSLSACKDLRAEKSYLANKAEASQKCKDASVISEEIPCLENGQVKKALMCLCNTYKFYTVYTNMFDNPNDWRCTKDASRLTRTDDPSKVTGSVSNKGTGKKMASWFGDNKGLLLKIGAGLLVVGLVRKVTHKSNKAQAVTQPVVTPVTVPASDLSGTR